MPNAERRALAGAVEKSVWIAAVIGGAIWVAEMARISFAMNLSGRSAQATALAVALAASAVIAIGVQRKVTPLAFVLTLLAAIFAVSGIDVEHGQSILKPIYAWVSPAIIISAALAARRLAFVLIGVAATALLVELTLLIPGTVLTWSRNLFVVVWSTVLAIFINWLITVLRRAAAASDESTSVKLEAYRQREYEAERARQSGQLGRLLHDTLINTLGVIRDGISPDLLAPLRDRCRLDLRTVAEVEASAVDVIAEGAESIGELATDCEELARVRGLEVSTNVVGRRVRLPKHVLQAVRDICAEGLTNVGKHSGSRDATLTIIGAPDELRLVLTDAGVGFDAASATGSGIDNSMRARAQEAGLDLTLDSTPGVGTSITVTWQALPTTGRPSAVGDAVGVPDQIFPLRGGRVLWLVWSLAVLQAIVQAPGQAAVDVALYFAAAATIGLAMVLAVKQSRSPRGLRVGAALGLTAAGAFGVWASASGQGLCSPNPQLWVGSTTVLIALCVLTVFSQRLWWLALVWSAGLAATTWVAVNGAGPGCSAAITVLDGCQIIAFGLCAAFVLAASRTQRQVSRSQAELADAVRAAALDRARTGRIQRRLRTAVQLAEPLLAGVVEDPSSANDPTVRAAAGCHEVTLRSIAQLPDLPDDLDALLLELLVLTDQLAIPARIWFTGDARRAPSGDLATELVEAITSLVAKLQTADRLALHFVLTDSGGELRIAADTTGMKELVLPNSAHVTMVSVVTQEQVAVIASW